MFELLMHHEVEQKNRVQISGFNQHSKTNRSVLFTILSKKRYDRNKSSIQKKYRSISFFSLEIVFLCCKTSRRKVHASNMLSSNCTKIEEKAENRNGSQIVEPFLHRKSYSSISAGKKNDFTLQKSFIN